MLAEQSITRMETLHGKNIIHRDIKPENFVIGLGKTGKNLHLIDFGLAKYYRSKSGKHIPLIDGKGLVGTARYCSVNTHKGIEQSRRDDLESIAYTLVYYLKSKLPWQGLKPKKYNKNKPIPKNEKYNMIKEVKSTLPLE